MKAWLSLILKFRLKLGLILKFNCWFKKNIKSKLKFNKTFKIIYRHNLYKSKYDTDDAGAPEEMHIQSINQFKNFLNVSEEWIKFLK